MAVKAVCHIMDIQYASQAQFYVRVKYLMTDDMRIWGDVTVLVGVPVLLNTFNLELVQAMKDRLGVGVFDTVLLLNSGLL